ncbi:uroporphyrinogen III synthase [Flavobacterium rivuli WB 3.3-2 = DSM 21788]|uniref:Uroporphyrinogen III synthase n=1 Tax=Flavobacterium rivuli WB 3.3-2 = DSM 21788 TaxID=1121895 RepID=A0A0A2M283_9FLAO|nr:uroporphyrinogen-III synthase [Flavobacterium rivuli]KGO85681.1 uroporphyrinogen III synthase [Flavobacterium rivuli WB 3.3-2 = DSM 21788]
MAAARVLSTKKLQPNQKHYLLNAGLSVIEADFIGVNYKPFTIQHTNTNLIFTSKNAFKSFLLNDNAVKFKDSVIFCVGSKTKETIEKNGYTVLAYADTAEQLSDIIIKDHADESFTFFSGSMRRDTLPDALAKANITVDEVEVYETILTPHTIKSQPDGLLFFSPSAIASYLSANAVTTEVCFCIGATTAAALNGITNNVIVANKPSVENVIIQCINHYKN